tara:strand:- start:1930 stop:2514 length:585 start_codon:yes stop_codon:yes gene_type:complete
MSDSTYKGVVSRLYEKEWSDRDSGREIVLHSFQIEGEKRYFRTGTRRPSFNEGEAISFVADAKSGNVDLKSVKKVATETVQAPKPQGNTASAAPVAAGSRDGYWAEKERRDIEVTAPRIAYSAAQKNATTLVAAALAADALSFGSTPKGKRLDMLVDYVEQTTLRLAKLQTEGHILVAAFEPQAKPDSSDHDYE